MAALNNPFSPGAGSPPPELAGRDDLLTQADITLRRVQAGRYEQSVMLVGLRGVGKTALLNKVRELADAAGYASAMIEATESRSLPELLVPALRQVLFQLDSMAGVSSKVKRGLRVLRSFVGAVKLKVGDIEVGLDIDPEQGSADSGDLESDLAEMFVALGEAAQDRGRAVAMIIDEIQYLSETADECTDHGHSPRITETVARRPGRRRPAAIGGAGGPLEILRRATLHLPAGGTAVRGRGQGGAS